MDDLIPRARKFATEAHRRIGHQRKYTKQPYDVHLKSVAERVASVTDDPEMIAAAWLHDAVEDTPATVGEIEREFGRNVADLVDALTDVSLPSDGSRAVRKAKDRAHTASAPQRAKTIKLADLIDNAKDMDIANRIRATWPGGEWVGYLSAGRRQKAQDFLEERRRRGQHLDLLDCLQLSDKGQILMRDSEQRKAFGLSSAEQAKKVVKELVSLRDNLAHASDIVTNDWPQIARMARRIEDLATGTQ